MNASKFQILKLLLPLLFFMVFFNSCGVYSFTGASIPPNARTIRIDYFKNKAPIVQGRLSSTFTDKLKEFCVSQTNLTLIDAPADMEIRGEIIGYSYMPVAIQSDDRAALERLTITIRVIFINKLEPKFNFEQNFSRYADYAANQVFSSVEHGLTEEIVDLLVDDIYQKAFVNW